MYETDPNRIAALRHIVERKFVQQVLDACEQRIHSRFGHAVILKMRSLSTRFCVQDDEIDDRDTIDSLGRDLADSIIDQIERLSQAERRSPQPDAPLVIFDEPAHLRAVEIVHQIQHQQKTTPWFLEHRPNGVDAWSTVCTAGASELEKVLGYLTRLERLETVVTHLSPVALRRALDLVPVDAWPESVQPTIRRRVHSGQKIGPTAMHTDSTRAPFVDSRPVRPKGQDGGSGSRPAAPVAPKPTPVSASSTMTDSTLSDLSDRTEPANKDAQVAETSDHIRQNDATIDVRREEASPETIFHTEMVSVSDPGNVSIETGSPEDASREQQASFHELHESVTHYGGLFYLLRLLMIFDLPELLWCAGIDEKPFLYRLAHCILGPDATDDPALVCFSGTSDSPLAPIPDWAAEEIREKTRVGLNEWIARCGRLDEYDPAELSSQFTAASDDTGGLVEFCAALLMIAFCCAVDEPPTRASFVHFLKLDGQIIREAQQLHVVLPMKSVDIRLRRAGLDFNPGYLPWLKSDVRILFE